MSNFIFALVFIYSNLVFGSNYDVVPLGDQVLQDWQSGLNEGEILVKHDIDKELFNCIVGVDCKALRTVEQAIAYDYGNGEDFEKIYDRYGVSQKYVYCLVEAVCDETVNEKPKTLLHSIAYDYVNSDGNYLEEIEKRYRVNQIALGKILP